VHGVRSPFTLLWNAAKACRAAAAEQPGKPLKTAIPLEAQVSELPTRDAALLARYGDARSTVPDGPWNAVLASMLAHRSVRAYKPDALPPGTLETVVAAAQSAATSSNMQTWSVVATTGRDGYLDGAERGAPEAGRAGLISAACLREASLASASTISLRARATCCCIALSCCSAAVCWAVV